MAAKNFTIHTRRFMTNKLLRRRQFVVDVIHPGRGSVPKDEIRARIMEMYKASDISLVTVFGFEVAFGGGRSTGFGMIYDNKNALMDFEPKYRLIRVGLLKKVERPSRQSRRIRKNKANKARGKKKSEIKRVAKS